MPIAKPSTPHDTSEGRSKDTVEPRLLDAEMQNVVLVTGGAGYVGSHTCKALAQAGYEPVALDDLSSGHRSAVRWGPFMQACTTDVAALDHAFQRFKPVAVLHFAALLSVGGSIADPRIYYENNVVGTLSLLGVMRDHGVSRMVFSSSCTVYGPARRLPIAEDHPMQPISPYGSTKLLVERMLSDFSAAYNFRTVSLRYFNAAGADPDGDIGEAHQPETHLIPLAIHAVNDSRYRLSIFGTDYDTPDGTAIRDYVHVTDLADAHVRALEYLTGGGDSTSLNLGTERGYSVREVISEVSAVMGHRVKITKMKRRPGDPPNLVSDSSKARRLLGWRSPLSDLSRIVKTAAAWHSETPIATS